MPAHRKQTPEFIGRKEGELEVVVFIPAMEYGDCGKNPFPFIIKRYEMLGRELKRRLGHITDNESRFCTETEVYYSPDKESRLTAKIISREVNYWSESAERSILSDDNFNKLDFEKVVKLARSKEYATRVLFLIRPFKSDFLRKIHSGASNDLVFRQQATAYILYLEARGVETMTWNNEK